MGLRGWPRWRGSGVMPRHPGRVLVAGVLVAVQILAGAWAARAGTPREQPEELKGQLLVATSDLRDPRFVRTVIYLIHHGADGAMGLVVNRPIRRVPLASLLRDLGLESQGVQGDIPVYYGGPVDPARGFVLHTTDYAGAGSEVVMGDIAVTSDPGVLRSIGIGKGPRKSLFALGYAGWAPGQLEAEIAAGFWIVVPADDKIVFDEDAAKKWERAAARRIIEL